MIAVPNTTIFTEICFNLMAIMENNSIQKIKAAWPKALNILWFMLPAAFAMIKYSLGPKAYNNYLIYKHVFLNIIRNANLYDFYPGLYLYQNHYGPSFSLIIAPFAVLPDAMIVAPVLAA